MKSKFGLIAITLALTLAACGGSGGGSSQTPGDIACTGDDCATPESPRVTHCGGISGAACPDGQQCADDPNDDCDPEIGADCGGICQNVDRGPECVTDADCAAVQQCFDCGNGVEICPAPSCEEGRCIAPVLDCPRPPPGPDCDEDADCAATLECTVCADGIEVCPKAACDNGYCLVAIRECPLPPPPGCGGFGGFQCPDGFVCVDDPNDDCDAGPAADCAGICEPKNSEQCTDDADCPTLRAPCPVCPDGSSACPQSHCINGACQVESRSCPIGKFCGGIAAFPCDDGFICIDDPGDDCDPNHGGADCGGVCVPDRRPQRCGGFIGTEDNSCPDGEECVDDPSDMCDAASGGADCPGVCQRKVEPTCASDADCPQIRIPCSVCADGSEVCASSGCVNGQCNLSFPSCPPPLGCDDGMGSCKPGYVCVSECDASVSEGVCSSKCVPDGQRRCGGFAGDTCPPGHRCADDPMDECDPNNGGADCIGVCEPDGAGECSSEADCPQILAPCTLCGDGSYACPRASCDRGQCHVSIDSCPLPDFCGGIAGFPCPAGYTCIDNPRDDCSPENGGADCGGICVPEEKPPQCNSDADCVRIGAPCHVCADGTAACPRSYCADGECRGEFPTCDDPALPPT